MRRLVVLVMLVTLVTVINAFGSGLGEYSVGYRMGQLSKFSTKGIWQKSGEGQMLMGRESSPYTSVQGSGKDKVSVRINPWYFSAEESLWGSLQKFSGEYVVIEYTQAQYRNPLTQDTDYTATKVYPVTRQIPTPREFAVHKPTTLKSDGVRAGRVVKASYKGNLNKTYEIIIQVGNAGNQFKHMSVTSHPMFEYLVKVLKSGKSAKFFYVEHAMQFLQDTNYEIYKVSFPEDL